MNPSAASPKPEHTAGDPRPRAAVLGGVDYPTLQQCMHCGMCLPTCPTFVATGRERSGPRGRIALARAVADGRLPLSEEFAREMDFCVGCLACQTACPAGVQYAQILEASRMACEQAGLLDSPARSFYRWLGLRVLMTRPWLMRLVARVIAVQQRPTIRRAIRGLGLLRLAPRSLREQEPLAPLMDPPFSAARIRPIERPADAPPRARVALLTGCVQDIAFARVNRATADVLLAAGCEVVTPRDQPCCGSLHAHNGDAEAARMLARRVLDVFREDGPQPLSTFDAVISNAGGCGSHLRHYSHLLEGDSALADRARQWDAKVRDAQEFVVGLPDWRERLSARLAPIDPVAPPTRVAYDASCHLHHGQKVVTQPLTLLRAIPGLAAGPLPESDWCCGAAGIYTITQPEQARWLLERKLANLRATAPDVVATANPGCMHQFRLACQAEESLRRVRVAHPMELVAERLER